VLPLLLSLLLLLLLLCYAAAASAVLLLCCCCCCCFGSLPRLTHIAPRHSPSLNEGLLPALLLPQCCWLLVY
jgi:hypothetical protein